MSNSTTTSTAAAAAATAGPLKPVAAAAQLQRRKSMNAPRIAGLYDLERTIGQGHFAVVKLARHVFTGEQVAVKVIDKTNLDPVSQTHLMQEVRCMKLVQHPNIVRLYEVIDTTTKLFLILELGDYDMHDFIAKHEKGCPEPIAQQFFSQIITAINYCHKLHVVHRDLKPENVVFFEKLGMVKLTDFGFSNLYEPGEQLRTSCGSLAYSAPEILLGDAYDAPAVDVWSLGVILFMLVTGRLPFQETNDSETLTKILDCRFSLPEGLSNPCRTLILRMLVRDPAKRCTLEEIAASPWVIAGERGHADVLPLVVRHHLPDSAHTTIIEQMVNGRIGSEDEIISSLENGEYNYLSATYYLLAERVLSSYREQAARELAEKEAAAGAAAAAADEEGGCGAAGDAAAGAAGDAAARGPARVRSRSNSFRASVRRPCSILKEESEEELSTYLRSSRQSSRNSSPSVSMFGGGGGSARERVSPQALQELLELSRLSGRRAASPDSIRSSRSPSPPASTASGRTSPATSMLCRLKTPSVVLVGGASGATGGCASGSGGSGGMRKLSSSPHLLGICEEGEEDAGGASDTLLTEGHARQNRSASTTGVTVFCGERRDSSDSSASHHSTSHHHRSSSGHGAHHHHQHQNHHQQRSSLLRTSSRDLHATAVAAAAAAGNPLSPRQLPRSAAAAGAVTSPPRMVVTREGRPSPHSSSGGLTTYSAVRMIRPRQAVVSPDVCRRYEQHARFVTRSRRSTSCSSSETSDDEERRLTMLSSAGKGCGKRGGGGDGKDDEEGGGAGGQTGGASGDSGPNPMMRGGGGGGGGSGDRKDREGKGGEGAGGSGDRCRDAKSDGGGGGRGEVLLLSSPLLAPLRAIPEMTQLHADKQGRRRAGLLYRSATAEKVVAEWASAGLVLQQDASVAAAASVSGEGPAATAAAAAAFPTTSTWLRSILRTRSVEDLREAARDELCSASGAEAVVGCLAVPGAAAAASSTRSSSKSKRTVYSSASVSDSSSLSDLFSPSESEDSGLSITRRKRYTKRKRASKPPRADESGSSTVVDGKSHLEQWIDKLCVV